MDRKLLDVIILFSKRVAIISSMADDIVTSADDTNTFKGQKIARDMNKIQHNLRKIDKEIKTILQYANTPDLMM